MTTTTTRAKRKSRKPRDLSELVSISTRNAAVRARRAVLSELDKLTAHRPPWHHQASRKRAVRKLAGPYLKAINAIRETVSRDELARLQQTLTSRLEQGWELEATDARDQLFARLLTDYEIVCDSLNDAVLPQYLERIEAREALWRD